MIGKNKERPFTILRLRATRGPRFNTSPPNSPISLFLPISPIRKGAMDLLLHFAKKTFTMHKYLPQTNAYALLNSSLTAVSQLVRDDIAHVSHPRRRCRYPQTKEGRSPCFA